LSQLRIHSATASHAGAKIIQHWMDVRLWLTALIPLIAMNLFSVSSFGEFEWFVGIKVAAMDFSNV
jgi:L-asparagine transporter-like permease